MIKILAPIILVSLIFLAVVGINYRSNQKRESNPPAEKSVQKPSEEPTIEESTSSPSETDLVNKNFVMVKFKEGVDLKIFAKRYEISYDKIEGPSEAGIYRIPVPQDKTVLTMVYLFEKDSDVESAKPEVGYAPGM